MLLAGCQSHRAEYFKNVLSNNLVFRHVGFGTFGLIYVSAPKTLIVLLFELLFQDASAVPYNIKFWQKITLTFVEIP
jgi:hypothetical protein